MSTTQRDTPPRYRRKVRQRSPFDNSPTLITNEYYVPKQYAEAVKLVISARMSGTPFNKAVDHVASAYPHLNRNKLAEHTLKTIANEY